MPARRVSWGALCAALAIAVLAVGCMGGGDGGGGGGGEELDGGEAQEAQTDTGPDVEALRAEWADAAGAACSARSAAVEDVARTLAGTVESEGLPAAGTQLADADATAAAAIREAEPAPGDEAQAEEMAALLERAAELRGRALAAPYRRGDRRFYTLIEQANAVSADAEAIAAELGATGCADGGAGLYSTTDELLAVRWGDRASRLCRTRDRTFTRLRPTDVTRFEAAARRWLRETRALESPKRYARRIGRALDMYAESLEASEASAAAAAGGDVAALEALNAKTNRLTVQSSKLLYGVGFEIGFEGFCSARSG